MVPEGEERKDLRKIFGEIIAKTFLTWERKQSTKSRKCRKFIPGRINPKRRTLRHTGIKLKKLKTKENIKSNKGKMTNNIQGKSHDFPAEVLQERREWCI